MEETKALDRIPAELLDHIASHLDQRSLKSLSLVNHTLCGTAQRDLFKEIHICYTVCIGALMERDLNHTSIGVGFLELLTSSPHLASYIQDLQINFERCTAKLHKCHRPQVSLNFILLLLTRLQRLLIPFPALAESLSNQSNWKCLKPATRAAIQRSLQSPLLLEADLRGFRNVPPDVFENCPSLQHLSLDALAISQSGSENNGGFELPLTPSLTKNIKFLELGIHQTISSDPLDATASYLLRPLCTIPIQRLCYLVVSFPLQLDILSDILSHCSEYLEYLSFVSLLETQSCYITTGNNKRVKRHALPPLDLSTLLNLRILAIHTRIDATSPSSYLSALPWIRDTLDTLPLSLLEKVILEVTMKGFPRHQSSYSMTILTIDWSDIPHAFLWPHGELKFNNLMTVKLKLRKLSPNLGSVDRVILGRRRKVLLASSLLQKLRAHKDFVRLYSEHLQNLHGHILSIS